MLIEGETGRKLRQPCRYVVASTWYSDVLMTVERCILVFVECRCDLSIVSIIRIVGYRYNVMQVVGE